MSVDCEAFIGYTVTLKEKLSHEDFDFFEEFTLKHKEYFKYNHESKSNVKLIVDGMWGFYARLIYIDEHIEECWVEGKKYFPLKNQSIPDDVYDELNKAYNLMYKKDLDKNLIEYSLWFHFS